MTAQTGKWYGTLFTQKFLSWFRNWRSCRRKANWNKITIGCWYRVNTIVRYQQPSFNSSKLRTQTSRCFNMVVTLTSKSDFRGTLRVWYWCKEKNREHKKSAENSALFLLCRNDEIIAEWFFPVLGNKSSVSRRYSTLWLTKSTRPYVVGGKKSIDKPSLSIH